jgi:serine/threonine-protein kinase RsbW
MTISDWINAQIDALRAMIVPDEAGDPPLESADSASGSRDGITESRTDDQLRCRFRSHPEHLARVRKSIEQFCSDAGLDDPACDEVGLVVNEALANVIRHAYSGAKEQPVETTVQRLNPGVKIIIRDWGNGIKPANTRPQIKDPLVPGGLGLICMKKLMDEMDFIPQPDGMLLVMTRSTPGSKAAGMACEE